MPLLDKMHELVEFLGFIASELVFLHGFVKEEDALLRIGDHFGPEAMQFGFLFLFDLLLLFLLSLGGLVFSVWQPL